MCLPVSKDDYGIDELIATSSKQEQEGYESIIRQSVSGHSMHPRPVDITFGDLRDYCHHGRELEGRIRQHSKDGKTHVDWNDYQRRWKMGSTRPTCRRLKMEPHRNRTDTIVCYAEALGWYYHNRVPRRKDEHWANSQLRVCGPLDK